MEELLNIEQFFHRKFNKFNIIIIFREFGGTFLGSKKALQKKQ
jgi:hypothetical protein